MIEKAEMLDDIKTSNASLRLMPLGALQRLVTSESKLRTWREYRGLTQTDLAKQVGVSQSAISQIESGKRAATLAMFEKIANALNLDLDDLI